MEEQKKLHLTCFGAHENLGVLCKKKECRQWIASKENYNCTILAAKTGPMTLQQIGDIFSVTRMRICQIEKIIIQKLSDRTCSHLA